MRIVRIQGGLGNQMFQYAFACKLKHLFPNESVLLDVSSFRSNGLRRFELKDVFNVSIPCANPIQLLRFAMPVPTNNRLGRIIHGIAGVFLNSTVYTEKRSNFFAFVHEPLSISKACYYDGFWFNEGYFQDIADEIKDIYTFVVPLNSYGVSVKNDIQNTNSVSIHVRRGDYLLYDAYKGICDKEYYERAITYIKKRVESPHFFIFSNDIPWCRENLNSVMEQCTFVENNDAKYNFVDMQLMSLCKHNIIAHSSFSWWGAWLNTNPNKVVVAPYKWVNSKDIPNKPQLKDWILINQDS